MIVTLKRNHFKTVVKAIGFCRLVFFSKVNHCPFFRPKTMKFKINTKIHNKHLFVSLKRTHKKWKSSHKWLFLLEKPLSGCVSCMMNKALFHPHFMVLFIKKVMHLRMSRFLSLCSQHSACGVLARVIHLLDSECEGNVVHGGDEVHLGKTIGKVEHIGCACKDSLDALAMLSSIAYYHANEWDIQVQALGCTALLLQRMMKEEYGKTQDSRASQVSASACEGIEVVTDIEVRHTIELLRQASYIGSGDASLKLGICCFEGDCVVQDRELALELYQQAAETGCADAMYRLGACYEDGNVTVKNSTIAFRLYQEAAEMGHAGAMFKLAVCYEYGHAGESVPKDVEKSRKWYKWSADLGYDEAIQALKKGHPFLTLNIGLPQWHH